MIFLRYTGKGRGSIPGVPARDLTKEETDRHGGEFRLVLSGLYERAKRADFTEVKPYVVDELTKPERVMDQIEKEALAAETEAPAETDEKPKRRNRRAKE